jgi:phosphoglycolate phosphatase-like HAD superfamily hydrolase
MALNGTDTGNRARVVDGNVLQEFRGVVYDLDGTLVELSVDWDAAARDAFAACRDAGVDPETRDLWTLLDDAPELGVQEPVEAALSRHEREGARSSRRLPLADALHEENRPVGVCTLNCEGAAHAALDVHDLAGAVDVVVGRDTVTNHKPHPEPLVATVDGLALGREDVVFVGDTERDADTARAADVPFTHADDLLEDH